MVHVRAYIAHTHEHTRTLVRPSCASIAASRGGFCVYGVDRRGVCVRSDSIHDRLSGTFAKLERYCTDRELFSDVPHVRRVVRWICDLVGDANAYRDGRFSFGAARIRDTVPSDNGF